MKWSSTAGLNLLFASSNVSNPFAAICRQIAQRCRSKSLDQIGLKQHACPHEEVGPEHWCRDKCGRIPTGLGRSARELLIFLGVENYRTA